ncbi:hypothetical protein BDV98DRAFT_574699 [Pterulicium gracile]|uniref:BTB domain-containing protein n=1 Tax=Pterulicium gracile TaxID=1884261 RepID=A0A5C3QAX9_9AGAR|nr:hypothetical protein BDV98DRAFT_574699 [Pterula gracilis]
MSTAPSTPVKAIAITSTSPSPTSPNAGFSASPRTDIIVRSSDGFDFYFSKTTLSLASTAFDALFDIATPAVSSSEPSSGYSVVPMDENGRCVRLILCGISPRTTVPLRASTPETLEEWTSLLIAAQKYDMEGMLAYAEEKLLRLLDAHCNTPITADSSTSTGASLLPIRIYCIAYRFRLTACARKAAQQTISLPIVQLFGSDHIFPELDLVTGIALAALTRYHNACCQAVCMVLNEHMFCRIAQVNTNTGIANIPWAAVQAIHTQSVHARLLTPSIESCLHCPVYRSSTPGTTPIPAKWTQAGRVLDCRTCRTAEKDLQVWIWPLLEACRLVCRDRVDMDLLNLFRSNRLLVITETARIQCQRCHGRTSLFNLERLQDLIHQNVKRVVSEVVLELPSNFV